MFLGRSVMTEKISHRLDLLSAFFSPKRDFPINWLDVLKSIVKRPCTHIGPAFIEQTEEDGEYLSVKIRSIPDMLFWPKTLPLFDLYKVVTECFYEDDTHFYEVPETRVATNDVVLDCGAAEGFFHSVFLSEHSVLLHLSHCPFLSRACKRHLLSALQKYPFSHTLYQMSKEMLY